MRRNVDNPWIAGPAVALLAWAIFLFRVTVPAQLVFDEVHYVRAARVLLPRSGPANV